MSHEEIISVNGIELFVVSEGEGTPIVLLHGGPGLGHSYLHPLIEALAGSFRVITYDQRGSGRSSDLSEDAITVAGHLDDLEGLRRVLGLERLNLVAHSFGVYFALLYAAQHPDSTASLVLANAGPPFVPEMIEMLEREFAQRRTAQDSARMAQIRASDGFKARQPNAVEEYMRITYMPFFRDRATASQLSLNFTETTAHHVLEAEEAMIPQVFEMRPKERLADITCPTLVVHAEHDAIPQVFSELLAMQIAHAELVILQETGHFAFFESPQSFIDAVAPFLREHAR
ncbi:MAG: alpha/beta fold hydrolase [Chloroflexi bacterium]|nr:alpha/beta fold hydrolase [Chloroflexota bacterium]